MAVGRIRVLGVVASAVVTLTASGAWLSGGAVAATATQDSIVVVAPGVDALAVAAGFGLTPDAVWRVALHGFSADLTNAQVAGLRGDSRVLSVTANRSFRQNAGVLAGYSVFSSQSVPTAIARIGATSSVTADIDKRDDARVDVDVAVIDGQVQTDHPDLNVVGGTDCTGSGPSAGDGHATFAAGTIGAIDNKIGVVGVAPGARIWSVRIFDSQGISSDQRVLCGVEWVTAHANVIDVANMSFEDEWSDRGGTCDQPRGDALVAAICEMTAAGVTAVAAAGNDAADASGFQPAGLPGVITASALADYDGKPGGKSKPTCANGSYGPDDTFASFSNFGSAVDIAAPGACVTSTYAGGAYALWYGTSFSSSYTAGAAALYKATHPAATPGEVLAALVAAQEPGPIPGDPDGFPEGVLRVDTF